MTRESMTVHEKLSDPHYVIKTARMSHTHRGRGADPLARVQFPSVKEESKVFQGAVYPE